MDTLFRIECLLSSILDKVAIHQNGAFLPFVPQIGVQRPLLNVKIVKNRVNQRFINLMWFEIQLFLSKENYIMKKIIALSAFAIVASAFNGQVFAEDAPAADAAAAAPAPDTGPVTANVTLASQYRYRGISQSNSLPAVQGGFDYAHESGFYVGNWNSSISWIGDGYTGQNPSVSAPIEMDIYGGYKFQATEDVLLDVGFLEYYYPTKNLISSFSYTTPGSLGGMYESGRQAVGQSPSTLEGYISATYGMIVAKYSYSFTNLFGIDQSKGSQYFDLSANYDTGYEGVTLNAHLGYQYVPNTPSIAGEPNFSYTDWKIGLTKDFTHGLAGAIAYIGTNASNSAYYNPNGDNTGKGTVVVSLTKTF